MNAEFEALAIRCRAPEQHTGPVGTRQSHRLPHKPLEDGRIHTSARVSNSPLMECHAQLSTGTLRANATNPPWPKGQDRFRGLLVRRASRNCSTQRVASWAGESPGRPSRGYQLAKSSSHHSLSSRSRTHIAVVPPGLLARAICAVKRDLPTRTRVKRQRTPRQLNRTTRQPEMPTDHARAPGSTKITDGQAEAL